MAYRFGEFVYDASNRALHRGEEEVALTPKTRDLLGLFLQNPSRLLRRQEIVDRLWPDVAVSDDALRFQVAELRKALGDESESFIKTIPREGYRWQAPVRSGASVAPTELSFRLVLENREVELEEGENILGRDRDAAVWIDHTAVSRHHARIVRAGQRTTLEDLGSKNGTYLRGQRLKGPRRLANGDEIRIGPISMIFRVLSRTGTTETDAGA